MNLKIIHDIRIFRLLKTKYLIYIYKSIYVYICEFNIKTFKKSVYFHFIYLTIKNIFLIKII